MTKKTDPASTDEAGMDLAPRTGGNFPIVGIGASAEGLAAFGAFFSGMPAEPDPGMAFVVVQHLAPDHKSLLTELIRRYTRMQVFEVEDGMEVRPNCAYIIPPNRDMAFLGGRLQLMEPASPRGQRLPIDFFFRSLAQGLRERAIGIVLSGSGSDGAQGVRAIKGEGGMVIAQTPATTEYDGMPRSALATGLVDYELPPAEMPAQISAYVAHAFGKPLQTVSAPTHTTENALRKICILLRAQTGHDFSQYKPSTIHRRIERRMAVHQIAVLDAYIGYLQQNPAELEALFRDLLIGVTSFFRDPEAFKAIETQVVPKLFDGKPVGSLVRVWSAGCSTGEEAYSIAILLQEHLEATQQRFAVQVFATDIDSQAIATARSGRYPASIAADVSPERLARFFAAEADGSAYRIHQSIRDMLVFSEQDVIKNPPFSRLDCILCRNLLIYMGGELQKKLIPLFHYALAPGGFLCLGTSETVGDFGDLFSVLDRKLKLYRRKDDLHGRQLLAVGRFLPPLLALDASLPRPVAKEADPAKLPLRELTEQALLRQIGLSGALVNDRGDILYLHGRTGRYLEPAPGEAGVNNILKMAREGLRRELSTALHKARSSRETVRSRALRVKTNGDFTSVDLTVCPVTTGQGEVLDVPLYLVILEGSPHLDHEQARQSVLPDSGERACESVKASDAGVAALRQELHAKEEYLQTAIEELETSNEELKSSNEEMQSINEELQSSNEELETSKEELQYVNKELATVNAELQKKLIDLSKANSDISNLLAGTGIATIFLDRRLCILRFTPAATRIINMMQTDIGRPVGHMVPNMVGYSSLVADVQSVLATLIPKEFDVQTAEGRWYTMRILPYRTLDNVIEGAVLTFVDITEMKRSHALLQEAHDQLRLAGIARDSQDAIAVSNLDGYILAWNPSAQRLFGWAEGDALAMNIRHMIPEDIQAQEMENMRRVAAGDMQAAYETRRLTMDGRTARMAHGQLPGRRDRPRLCHGGHATNRPREARHMTDKLRRQAEALARADGSANERTFSSEEMRRALHELRVHQIELEMQNEELRRAQTELDAARARYFDLYDLAPVGYCTVSEQGLVLEANLTVATMLGLARGELVGKLWTRFIHKEDQGLYYQRRKKLFETAVPAAYELRLLHKDRTEFWAHFAAVIAQDAEGAPVCRIVVHDITERKQEERFREDVERIIQHDIKGPLINLFNLAQLVMEGAHDVSLMEAFPQIILGIRQVVHLINSAEPLRQMEKGEYTPASEPVEIYQILDTVKESLAVLSSQNHVGIALQATALDCSPGEPWLCGEAFLLEDMLMNLVKNAVEASPKEGLVTISCQTEPGALRIAIHNAGAVPEAVRGRFFEKYVTAGKLFGTGLGTYSAQLIAKAHGGRIEFTSSEAEGTRVTVVLPRPGIL
ncbi:chemotaxis protein CheB [Solidesulfovibrio sp.]|uniref:chemotaxis protein CheB n=1 Tax=Solidesulfovibrio sp. TaxID=2910990 RepID=UPI002609936C|nr:chemotaxis protein CheB [Solidesulfovibrio sp.]